jgi:hypothetical protein
MPKIWGWATWKRAWQFYDVEMKTFPEFKRLNKINNIFDDTAFHQHWLSAWQNVYDNKIDTWDYQWAYAVISNNGLCIAPNVNFITNIGFREDATHTKDANTLFANKERFEISKIVHPSFVSADRDADLFTLTQEWRIMPNNINIFNFMHFDKKCVLKKSLEIIVKLLN